MWYCSCGCENRDDAEYCADCGQPFTEPTVSVGSWPATQPPAEVPPPEAPAEPEAPAFPQEETDMSAYIPKEGEGFQSSYRAMPEPPAPVKPGSRRKASKSVFPPPPEPKAKKKKSRRSLWWLWLLAILGLLAAAAAICYFTVHIWTPATCTEPVTCRICGDTRGVPLGHSPQAADCTAPSICTRCGEVLEPALGHAPSEAGCTEPSVCTRCGTVLGPALGHEWQEVSYDSAETCSRCGKTRGKPLGWVGNLHGAMGEEVLKLYGNGESYPFELTEPVARVFRLTLNIRIDSYTGDPFGVWGLYGLDSEDPEGEWRLLGTFYLGESADQTVVRFSFKLSEECDLRALSVVAMTDKEYTVSYSFGFSEVQHYTD